MIKTSDLMWSIITKFTEEYEMDKPVKRRPRKMRKPEHEFVSVLSAEFKYTNAANTNVQDTWRKYGWVPQAERERS